VAELTQTEFEMLYLRRSVEDCEFILELLKADGVITVVPDRLGDATAARKKSKSAAKKKPTTGAKVKRPTGAKVKRKTRSK
jgi:hypothetical protein